MVSLSSASARQLGRLERPCSEKSATAVEVFRVFGQTSPEYDSGLQWLSIAGASNIDDIANRLAIFSKTNNNITSDLNFILAARRANGGWGLDADLESGPFNTALALQALKAANYSDPTVINQAINFLAANQNSDGGWGFRPTTSAEPGDPSNAYVTATVLRALSGYSSTFSIQSSIQQAGTFLLSKQNTNGGFGSSPSTVYETALSVISLLEGGQGSTQAVLNGMNYLTSAQVADGSWDDDPYSTALALQALAKVKPNLAISSADIQYAPLAPIREIMLRINATIINNGLVAADNITISFFDGDPSTGGIFIAQTTIPSVSIGGSGTTSILWSPATSGIHNIFVVVNPGMAIDEATQSDNRSIAQIMVYDKVDLTIQEITMAPNLPAPGQAVDADVKVKNAGGLPAEQVLVRLSVDGVQAGEKTITSIAGLQAQTVSFSLPNLATATHQVVATVDPLNAIAEADETNNTLSAAVEIKNRIDLMVTNASLYVSDSVSKEGDMVRIAARVYNIRENDAQPMSSSVSTKAIPPATEYSSERTKSYRCRASDRQ